MAKRFTDSDKWKKLWFRKLTNDNKVFWMYLLDQCDHAGIWEVDFDLASYFCNGINEQEVREIFSKQFYEFDNGKRWFLKDFIDFQYNELNAKVNAHRSVIIRLKKFKLLEKIDNIKNENQQFINSSLTVKDKDKDKDKVKVKDKDKGKKDQLEEIKLNIKDYQFKFPNIDCKLEHEKFIGYIEAHGKTYKNYSAAFKNWLRNDAFGKAQKGTKLNNNIVLACPDGHMERVSRKGINAVCPECHKHLKPKEELTLEGIYGQL